VILGGDFFNLELSFKQSERGSGQRMGNFGFWIGDF
jgi:hypothetical protein